MDIDIGGNTSKKGSNGFRRIKTGITGLDTMLNGGLIEGRAYVISGGAGAGKTILSVQYLIEGLNQNENVLYVTLEEPSKEIIENTKGMWQEAENIAFLDMSPQIPEGKVQKSITSGTLRDLLVALRLEIEKVEPQRVVVDSLTPLRMMYDDKINIRRTILYLMKILSNAGCTSLLISETTGEKESLIEEFLARGSIKLHMIEQQGEKKHAISIRKFRGSSFDKFLRPLDITDKGLEINISETFYSPF